MKIIAVRHGETKENKARVLMGHMHGTLSKAGYAQIAKLAHSLKGEKIDAIFSSDLDRAAETARGIARYHKAPISYVKALREQNYGIFQGQSLEALITAEKSSNLKITEFRPSNGESLMDVRNRVERFVKRLNKKYGDKTILLSTHSGVIRCLISIYLDMPMEKVLQMDPKNTEIVVMEINGTRARLVKFKAKPD
jgi:broad specificity phosphatase PhoE